MKKIILFIAILLAMTSCKKNNHTERRGYEYRWRYKVGEVVYLKPDSLKVVVFNLCDCNPGHYDVYYFDNDKQKQVISTKDELIY